MYRVKLLRSHDKEHFRMNLLQPEGVYRHRYVWVLSRGPDDNPNLVEDFVCEAETTVADDIVRRKILAINGLRFNGFNNTPGRDPRLDRSPNGNDCLDIK